VPSHALRLTLREGALTADYSLRVPTHEIVQELNALDLDAARRGLTRQDSDAFIAAKLDELRDGLVLKADGAPVPWERLPLRAPTGLGNTRHVQFDQTLQAELAPGRDHPDDLQRQPARPAQPPHDRADGGRVAVACSTARCGRWRTVENAPRSRRTLGNGGVGSRAHPAHRPGVWSGDERVLWRLNNPAVEGARPAAEARLSPALTRARDGDLPELPFAVALCRRALRRRRRVAPRLARRRSLCAALLGLAGDWTGGVATLRLGPRRRRASAAGARRRRSWLAALGRVGLISAGAAAAARLGDALAQPLSASEA
jgi:hypothetical protein